MIKTILTTLLLAGCATTTSTIEIQDNPMINNVYFTPKVVNSFFNIYGDQKREIPLCLEGLRVADNYIVHTTKIPFIVNSDEVSSTYNASSCYTPEYLGMVHNHPTGPCRPSDVDLKRFREDDIRSQRLINL